MPEVKDDLPLSPYFVLDLTRARAGPTAARQLADWGANVIKVEELTKPGDEDNAWDLRHGSDFQNLHRNKRSLTLNLKDPAGLAIFKKMADINLNHVPYRGAGPALTDVVAGQVQVMFASSAPALPQIRSGRLRPLGISSLKRSAIAPEIPTIEESGLPGFEAITIFGLVAPAKTPPSIVELLNSAVHKAMRGQDVEDSLKTLGADVAVSTPGAFGDLIQSEAKRWGELVRALNLQVE